MRSRFPAAQELIVVPRTTLRMAPHRSASAGLGVPPGPPLAL